MDTATMDWRALFQRQRIVNKIMDMLKRHLPFTGYERLQELNKIAERVEHEMYTVATTQSEYSRKICFMILTMETRLQNPTSSNAAANSVNSSVPFDSTAHTGNSNGRDWQEEVYQKMKAMKDLYQLELTAQTANPNGEDLQEEAYQKIKAMKDLYLLDLNEMHQKILFKLQQHDSLPQQPKNERIEKLKVFKNMLERFIQFLQIPKHVIFANYKHKLGTYEKQIIHITNSYKRKPAAPQQQAQALPSPHMQSLQQIQVQLHENQMNLQGSMTQMLQSNNIPIQQQSSESLLPTQVQQSQPQLQQQVMPHMQSQPGQLGFKQQNVINMQKQLCLQKRAMPEASSNFAAQTSNLNDGDWQEEVYQKIKAMKDLYLLGLNDYHQRVISKLQQHNSLPQQPRNEQLEKLEEFRKILESHMNFLQIPKHGVLASYKDKMGIYEKQITHIINCSRQMQQAQALPPWKTLLDSTAQTGNLNGRDWQEKIKATDDMYLLDLRPTQGSSGAIGDPTVESGDWRPQLQTDSRQRIVNKIMDTLKMYLLPVSGNEGLQKLKTIAVRFEEKIYIDATSQSDYLRKISLKMLTLETRPQCPMPEAMQSKSTANSVNPSDPGVS